MSFRSIMHFALLVSLPAISQIAAKAEEPAASGFVYVMTNRAEGNSVLVYRRASTGVLTLVQEAPTKGLGTGFATIHSCHRDLFL